MTALLDRPDPDSRRCQYCDERLDAAWVEDDLRRKFCSPSCRERASGELGDTA